MKKNILLVLTIGLFFFGCSNEDSLVSPVSDSEIESLNKLPLIPPLNYGYSGEIQDVPQHIKVKKKLAKNYTFDGAEGGKIVQKYTWYTVFDTLQLEAYLTIPAGAYEGELTFEIVFDPNEISMELHPTPMDFDIPVILDLMYKGIPKKFDIDSNNLDFEYYNPDGSYENVEYQNIIWNEDSRTLMVKKAELHHFSRYGWTRKK